MIKLIQKALQGWDYLTIFPSHSSLSNWFLRFAAATAAKTFGCQIDSVYFNISLTLDLIEKLNDALDSIMQRIHQLIAFHKNEKFIQQIK